MSPSELPPLFPPGSHEREIFDKAVLGHIFDSLDKAEATEQHRHRCEVRSVLRWRVEHGRDWCRDWIFAGAKSRGEAWADRFTADCAAQWQAGNRGDAGEWRE